MKIAIVLGTRPEIIKMDTVIKECALRRIPFFIIHTNQHYTAEMDVVIFKNLGSSRPKYNLGVGSGIHGLQTGKMLAKIEDVLAREKPTCVLVHGDTNTTLAGALAARKMNFMIGHIEAGLRSFDQTMPEEVNRVLVDHMSDFCFAPTSGAARHLHREGIRKEKVFVTGNTIVDAVHRCCEVIERGKGNVYKDHGVSDKQYFLVTLHRPSNVDNKKNLSDIVKALGIIARETGMPVVYPAHPRTKKMLEQFNISLPKGVCVKNPLGFLEFLMLERGARVILTDSGGVQEEACIFGVPCVTLRKNTERPETLEVGANTLVGGDTKKIIHAVRSAMHRENCWVHPFGKGNAGKQIIDVIARYGKKK